MKHIANGEYSAYRGVSVENVVDIATVSISKMENVWSNTPVRHGLTQLEYAEMIFNFPRLIRFIKRSNTLSSNNSTKSK